MGRWHGHLARRPEPSLEWRLIGGILEGTWKVGDLGRFLVEEPRRPRFEVLGSKPDRGTAIWYGGNPKPVFVPRDTFLAKCVNTWTIEVVPQLPDWIAPNAVFKVVDERAAKVTQAVIKQGYNTQISQVNVRGHDMRIRRIQYDYCSCFDESEKVLVMVPLKILIGFGLPQRSRWDRLLSSEDIIGEEVDAVDRLLRQGY